MDVARRSRIDGIICDTTDVGVPTAAYVAEQLGLPGMGFEVALNFTNKIRMRQMTERAGLKVPNYRPLKSEEGLAAFAADLGMPVVLKPVDNQSGKGVSLVAHRDGLHRAFRYAMKHSAGGRVLIEPVIKGVEIVVDGFVVDGNVHVLGIARKTQNPLQPTVSTRITYGEPLPKETAAQIDVVTRLTLTALGLKSGVFHGEYILSGDDVIPIDVAARGGGCMIYTHVLPYVSGVDANSAMIAQTMGDRPSIIQTRSKAANIEFFGMPEGVLAAVNGTDQAARQPGVLGVHMNIGVGDCIGSLDKKDDRPGYIVSGGDAADGAIAAALAAKSVLRVKMQGDNRYVYVI